MRLLTAALILCAALAAEILGLASHGLAYLLLGIVVPIACAVAMGALLALWGTVTLTVVVAFAGPWLAEHVGRRPEGELTALFAVPWIAVPVLFAAGLVGTLTWGIARSERTGGSVFGR